MKFFLIGIGLGLGLIVTMEGIANNSERTV